MKSIFKVFLLVLLVLSGCSKKQEGLTDEPRIGEPQAASPPLKLSQVEEGQFSFWKKSLLKSCDAYEIFGYRDEVKEKNPGIDPILLSERNNHSLIFRNKDKEFFVVTGFESFTDSNTHLLERTTELDGKKTTIKAEAKLDGDICSVYLYGEKVYEVKLFKSAKIGIYSKPLASGATHTLPYPSLEEDEKQSEIIEINSPNFTSSLLNSISPQFKVKEELMLLGLFVARAFGVDREDVWSIFSVDKDYLANPFSGAIDFWVSDPVINLFPTSSVLVSKEFYDFWLNPSPDQKLDSSLEKIKFQFSLPSFEDLIKRDFSKPNYLDFTIYFNVIQNKEGLEFTFEDQEIKERKKPEEYKARRCLEKRAEYYFSPQSKNQDIDFKELMLPCKMLWNEVDYVSLENKTLVKVNQKFWLNYERALRKDTPLSGWNLVLSDLAFDVVSQGKHLVKELDPKNKIVLFNQISENINYSLGKIETYKELAAYQKQLVHLVVQWTLQGKNIKEIDLDFIFESLNRSIKVFEVSTLQLYQGIIENPDKDYSEDLGFILSMDDEYKNMALEVLALSKNKDENFEKLIFNKVIQKRVTVEELKKWREDLLR